MFEITPLQDSMMRGQGDNRAQLEGGSLETLKHMVASGLGVTVLPSSAADVTQYGSNSLVTRPFVAPVPLRKVALAWRVSYPRHQAIDVLTDALRSS